MPLLHTLLYFRAVFGVSKGGGGIPFARRGDYI